MKTKIQIIILLTFIFLQSCNTENKVIWKIGEADNSSAEFALSPNKYEQFIDKDFGWEDKFFLIGTSSEKENWPYVIPGPTDKWGGTWSTSGWRSHTLNILFGIDKLPNKGDWKLVVDIQDINTEDTPIFKISVNDKSWKYELPTGSGNNSLEGKSTKEIEDNSANEFEYLIEIPIPKNLIKRGGNNITITTIQGSWIMFDQIRLEGPENAKLIENGHTFLRNVKAATYEIENKNVKAQPLLVDIEHISGEPELKVILDKKEIFNATVETGRYVFEAPMPAVTSTQKSK